MDLGALLLLLAAAPDLTLHPPPPSPDAGAAVRAPGPDVTAIFRVGYEGDRPGGREYHLKKHTDGSYSYDDDQRFLARIAPDGGVTFHDKPTVRMNHGPNVLGAPARSWSLGSLKRFVGAARRGEAPDPMTGYSPYHGSAANERDRDCAKGRVGCRFPPMLGWGGKADATDAVMRAHGQDPYHHEKARFIEATGELRIQMAVENRRKLLKGALETLPYRLDELWADERWSVAERQRIVVLLLAEIDANEPAGQRAAEIIRRFACQRFPVEARAEVPGLTCVGDGSLTGTPRP